VAVLALHPEFAGMDVVPEEDRLAGSLERGRIEADDDGLACRWLLGAALAGESDRGCDSDGEHTKSSQEPLTHIP
jgi:hypothetical protein